MGRCSRNWGEGEWGENEKMRIRSLLSILEAGTRGGVVVTVVSRRCQWESVMYI